MVLARNTFIGALVVLIFAVLVLREEPIRYDDGDPRYAAITKQLSEISDGFARGDYSRTEIDLASPNDGVWATACVFGGYNDPLREMVELGARVSPADELRLQELGDRDFRIDPVEEFELMIVYVDPSNSAHFIHLERGFGAGGQHFKRCIQKPQTRVRLL